MSNSNRKILAAAFSALDRGSRAAGAVGGAFPDKVGNTAVLHVDAEENVKFVESKDWGAGRGAIVGAVIGIIGGPLGMLAGGGIGALAAKLRDSGFNDGQLERLGASLVANSSATVIEIAADAIPDAEAILKALGAEVVVVEDVDASVDQIFDSERPPAPEPVASAESVEAPPPPAA
jgi:hypothetical protein